MSGRALRQVSRRYRRSRAAVVGLALLGAVFVMMVGASILYPDDPLEMTGPPFIWPFQDTGHVLGTDNFGRDIAAGVVHGARTSLLIGGVATFVALFVGGVIGSVAGYYGGWTDEALMRLTEAFQTVPNFILLLVLVAILGPSIGNIILAIGVVSWTSTARIVRAEVLALRKREFVEACRSLGMGDGKIIFVQIMPNALPPVIVLASVVMAVAILQESALAFLGLGDKNVVSWGGMIGNGKDVLRTAWYVSAAPGCAILVTVLGISLVGQGLNDVLNPRMSEQAG